jgi:hypothetical protein
MADGNPWHQITEYSHIPLTSVLRGEPPWPLAPNSRTWQSEFLCRIVNTLGTCPVKVSQNELSFYLRSLVRLLSSQLIISWSPDTGSPTCPHARALHSNGVAVLIG